MLPNLGPLELLIVMGIAVLLFGKRLPEVGRSLGRGIVEFKKGLHGVGEELDFNSPSKNYPSSYNPAQRYDEKPRSDTPYTIASIPKFEIPGAPSTSVPQTEYRAHSPHDRVS
jgi:sec-independent protein translocase protein TatA